MIGGLRGRMDVGKSKDKETNQNDGLKYGPRFLKIKHVDKATRIPFMFMYKVMRATYTGPCGSRGPPPFFPLGDP